MRFPVTATLCVMVAGLSISSGCTSGSRGPALHSVSGKVTLNGEPISQGSITFVPAAGTKGPSAGDSIKNGSYAIPRDKGLAAGNYRVEIRAPKSTGKQVAAQSPAPAGTMIDEIKESVPAKFNTESTLEAKIPAPSNKLDFAVTGP